MKVLSTVGWMAAFVAVGKGIELLITKIDDYVHASEKAVEKTEELKAKHEEISKEYESQKKTVNELASSYEKLSKGVDTATNTNLDLSEDDYEEYLRITNELVDIFPSLYETLDDNGNAILTLGQNGRTASEDLKALLQAEEDLNNYKISQDIEGLFGGVKVQVEEAKKAKEEFDSFSVQRDASLEKIKDAKENGISLDGDYVQLSYKLNVDDEYFSAISSAVENFKNSLDEVRQSELGEILSTPTENMNDNSLYDFYLSTYSLTDSERESLENEIKLQMTNTIASIEDSIFASSLENTQSQQSADLAWADFIPSLVATMKSQGSFKKLAEEEFGEDIQNFAIDLVTNLDSSIAEQMGENPYYWVRDNILSSLTNLSDADRKSVAIAYNKLLELNPNDLSETNQKAIDELILDIATKLGKTEEDLPELRLNLGFEVDEDFEAKYTNAITKAINNLGISKTEAEKIFTELGIDTFSEIDKWNQVTEGINDAIKAKERYLGLGDEKSKGISKSEMIDKLTGLSGGFDILDKIYADNKDGDVFDFANLDSKKFEEAFKDLGVEYEDFIEAIASSPNDLSKTQAAYDAITTALIKQNGILDNVTEENKNVTASYLELYGVTNAQELVNYALAKSEAEVLLQEQNIIDSQGELIESKSQVTDETGRLVDATDYEIAKFIESANASGIMTDALAKTLMEKILFSETALTTDTDIENLLALAEAAGFTSSKLLQLEAIKNAYNSATDIHEKNGYLEQLNKVQADIKKEVANWTPTAKYGGGNDSNKSSSDSTDKYLDEYKKKLAMLQDELDKELITEREFYDKSEALLNEYLKDTPEHIKKYEEEISDAEKTLHGDWINAFESEKTALEDLYNDAAIPQKEYLARLKQIIDAYYISGEAVSKYGEFTKEAAEEQRAFNDLYDDFVNNAFDGVSLMLDKVIDKYEKQKEAAEKAYEAQEKAIEAQIEALEDQEKAIDKQIDAVDKQIDAKQKEIDKIQEANDEINKQIQYQKNLYAVEEAQNNKSVATVKGGKVSYDIDYSALKDAKEAVRQDEEEKRIDTIQKEIDLLEQRKESYEEQKELIEEQKDLLEEQREAIQKMTEQSAEYFEKLIEAVTNYQSRWQELQSVAQDAQIIDGMKDLLNEWGISTEQVMNMSDSAFEQFKQRYMEHLNAMTDENANLKQSLNDTFMLNDISGFQDFIDGAVESMGLMGEIDLSSTTDGLSSVSEGLGIVEESANTATSAISTIGTDDEESPASLTGAIGTAYATASGTIPAISGMLDGVGASANKATNAVNNLASAINNLNSIKGSIGLPGHADGVKKIKEDEFAWTQEEGQELIVSPSKNAMFTPLNAGDSVLNAAMTSNIFEWGKINPNVALSHMGVSKLGTTETTNVVTNNNTSSPVNIEFNVSLPNVTDSSQAQELVNKLHSLSTAKFQFFNKRK